MGTATSYLEHTLKIPGNATVTAAPHGPVQRFFACLGPGLITGAADDDPSGISTYSVAGAAYGYAGLWTAVFLFPLMVAVQLMCARLGLVTGRGLASVIRLRYPPWVLWLACGLLIVANVFNIGADLGGMADAMQMVTGVSAYYWTPIFALLVIILLFRTSYRTIARIFKWLTLVLFAYVITAFLSQPNWVAVIRATLIPHIEYTKSYIAVLVGILGTTISPYLFFWQAAQEVEEGREHGTTKPAGQQGSNPEDLRSATKDVVTGMLFSNLVMYFIILTTASTLHVRGITHVETAKQAAQALLPLAGRFAYWLFTLGLIGTGMLAVPILAGSCAYAVAEGAKWRSASLAQKPHLAPRFYVVIATALLVGLSLDFAGFDAVKMLFWSAILNGILAPPLVILVVLLTSDQRVMGEYKNSPVAQGTGWLCATVMSVAAIALLLI